jgi:hypothetical protein
MCKLLIYINMYIYIYYQFPHKKIRLPQHKSDFPPEDRLDHGGRAAPAAENLQSAPSALALRRRRGLDRAAGAWFDGAALSWGK